MLNVYNDPILDELVMPEPEGLIAWGIYHDIQTYARRLRNDRAVRSFLNGLIDDLGYRVTKKPNWRDAR